MQKALRDNRHNGTLVDLLRHHATSTPNKISFIFLTDRGRQEQKITYGNLDRVARGIGQQLQKANRQRERALLLYPPSLEYIAAFFGCLYGGVIAVPAYPPHTSHHLTRLSAILKSSQATIALTTSPIMALIKEHITHMPELNQVHWLTTDNLDASPQQWYQPQLTSNDIAFLQYTSGSTALPKGVMVTHKNILHNELMVYQGFGHNDAITVIGWLPLYHDMGLLGNIIQTIYTGTHCVLMSPIDFLKQPALWLKTISKYRGTTSGGPNFAYEICIRRVQPEKIENFDLSSWTVAFNGAEPIKHDTIEKFTQKFEPYGFRSEAFYPCYGLAEATLFVSGPKHYEKPRIQAFKASELIHNRVVPITNKLHKDAQMLVSSGSFWLDQKVVIVDPHTSKASPSGEVGEIWVSGANVTNGYWNQEEITQQTFHAYLADTNEGPFLRTGDLGFIWNDELFIAGRLKDLIIIDGRNHYPQDIEKTVESCHPAIKPSNTAAFSIDHNGQERVIVVSKVQLRHLRSPEQTNAEAIAALKKHIRRSVSANHEIRLHNIVLITKGNIAKTSSGKIQRYACRQKYLNGGFTE